MEETTLVIPPEYGSFLEELKTRIRSAQVRAAVAVNSELVLLYWNLGKRILAAQSAQGYGKKIVPQLSADLSRAFPEMKGFSPRNLDYMLAFARAWPDQEVLQEVLAKLTWYHNIAILEKVTEANQRLWYARKAIENGWSRNVLVHHISGNLYGREGKAITNFDRTLPAAQSDLARQITKDPYNFEFLMLQGEVEERDLEKGLVAHIQKFLLELGTGFAFVGRQFPLEVAEEDFYIDLLFYHLKLRCYVVIELKTGKFKPEYVGKMNFYLAAVDDILRHPDDAPSIGLILCKEKKSLIVEYSLRKTMTPIGVADYLVTTALPDALRDCIPSVAEFERELADLENLDE